MDAKLTGNEKKFLESPFMVKMADGRMYVAALTDHQVKIILSLEKKGFLKREKGSLGRWSKL